MRRIIVSIVCLIVGAITLIPFLYQLLFVGHVGSAMNLWILFCLLSAMVGGPLFMYGVLRLLIGNINVEYDVNDRTRLEIAEIKYKVDNR